MEQGTNLTIKTTRDLVVAQYIKLRTFNELSKLENQVLTNVALRGTIGRRERIEIRELLDLSQYSFNNVLASLKKKNMLKHDPFNHSYSCGFTIPNPITSLTFNFEIIE